MWSADDLQPSVPPDEPVTVWIDSIRGIEATANGTPRLLTDTASGRAVVRFQGDDGTDNLFVDSSVSPLTHAEDFSVAVVFRTQTNDLTGENGPWFENTGLVDGNQLGLGQDWGMTLNGQGRVSTGMSGGIGTPPTTVYSTTADLNNGQFHTAIMTRQAGTLRLYVDEAPADVVSGGSSVPRSNLDLTFGSLTQGTHPLTGDIAHVRFYDGALTQSEVDRVQQELFSYYANRAPVAADDAYELNEDAELFFVPSSDGVLANDTDVDDDSLTARVVDPPAHGSVAMNEDGSFLYNPAPNYFGPDTFTYVARDFRNSNLATVQLTVRPQYDPPIAEDDFYQGLPARPLNIAAIVGPLANDRNPDQVELEAVLIEAPAAGTLDLQPDGSFVFDPGDFAGMTSFTYALQDGTGRSEPATVQIVINSSPTAIDDVYRTEEDQPLVVSAAQGVTTNDRDAQPQPLTAMVVDGPVHGQLVMQPDGAFLYTPETNYFGPDQFTYRVSDGFDQSGVATVNIEIEAVNDLPTTNVDSFLVLPDALLNVPGERGLLQNDTDIEDDPLTSVLATPPDHGTVQIDADGALTYQPDPGYVGRDQFSYVARDATGESEPTEVQIRVSSRPLSITEFLTANSQTLPSHTRLSPDDRFPREDRHFDWIEIQNLLDVPIDLAGFHLTDDPDDSTRWQFPTGSHIPAGGYLVVFASGENIRDPERDKLGLFHTNFGLASEGEYLALTDYVGNPIDAYDNPFPAQRGNISYGRLDNEQWYFPQPSPGAANHDPYPGFVPPIAITPPGQFISETVQVSIQSPDDQATIRYTLDGSEPTLENGLDYTDPFSIAATTQVRAAAFRDGLLPTRIETESYLNLEDIVRQSPDGQPPPGWPRGPVRGQAFDYGMDPEIVDDPEWGPQMVESLTQIPSLSIVTDRDHLFDPTSGIYVNASRDGRQWERPASVQLINPDGSTGFQIDSGIRIRGGFSRAGFNPKHSFRLFFRDVYEGSLEFPLFEDEGADTFSNVDLRTAQNYAWSNDTFNDQTRNTFLRDVFSRDLQREQGQPYTRSRYYHLYLNGQYWGLYQTEERPEASYAETYFGGLEENYDVVKASGGTLEATDGILDRWEQLWEIAHDGFDDVEDYFFVQGRNPDGTENPDLPVHIQMDMLIDFMINVIYTGNEDMPTTLGSGSGPNNFYAIRDPYTRDGWQLIAHDNEHNMLDVNYDQTRDDSAGRVAASFNPKYLHQQLDELPEYQIAFADRVHQQFFHDGILAGDNPQALMQTRIQQIDAAIIAESARWGDQHNDPPLDKDTWQAEVDWLLDTFLQRRREIVLRQLQNKGLYPSVDAPVFNQHGGAVPIGFELDIRAAEGEIWYTLNGSDPRQIGGSLNSNAQQWDSDQPVTLSTDTTLRARARRNGTWSALNVAEFAVGSSVPPNTLRIAELLYHPAAPTEAEIAAGFDDQDDFEFVELINAGSQAIDLTSARFAQTIVDNETQGLQFAFADSSITRLTPGQRVVIVEDLAAFRFRYGENLPVAGQWSGGLGNGGEQLTLFVDDQILQQFTYEDDWYETTDGDGYSLEIRDPYGSIDAWSQAAAWQASSVVGGTPGRIPRLLGDVNGDGRFDSSDLVQVFQAGQYEDAVMGNSTYETGDWDGDGDFTTSDLVFAFQSGSYISGARPIRAINRPIDLIFAQWTSRPT